MNYAELKKTDIANGEGVRVSLFVSGCRRHCKGCFNEIAWDFEPENQRALFPFVKKVKERFPEKDIWCFTGYTYDDGDILEPHARTEVTREFISLLDVLVDGKFEEALKDIRLVFRGSSNQRVIDVQKSLQSHQVILYLN